MIRTRLRVLLAERAMTQKQLAKLASVNPNTVSSWVRDDALRFDRGVLESFCKALSCVPGDILIYVPGEQAQGLRRGGKPRHRRPRRR